MASPKFPVRYPDPVYQQTHRSLFSNSVTRPIEKVLPPGLTQAEFDLALADFKKIVGKDGLFTGQSLEDYIDPYELWEAEEKRKVPSAAIWYAYVLILPSHV